MSKDEAKNKKVNEEVNDESQEKGKTKAKETVEEKAEVNVVTKEEYDKVLDLYTKAMNTAAHYENLQKYYKSEYEKIIKYRSQALVEELLPSLDGFHLAFKFDAPTKEAQNYRVGFEFVYKLLLDALSKEGISEIIPVVGNAFDSTKHQIIDHVETDSDDDVNKVSEVLSHGYMLKDRLIRPAGVKVWIKKTSAEVPANASDQVKN